MSAFTGNSNQRELLIEIAEKLIRDNDFQITSFGEGQRCKVWQQALKRARNLKPQTLGNLVFVDPRPELHRPNSFCDECRVLLSRRDPL